MYNIIYFKILKPARTRGDLTVNLLKLFLIFFILKHQFQNLSFETIAVSKVRIIDINFNVS